MNFWNDETLTAAESVDAPTPELVADLTAEIRRLQMRETYLEGERAKDSAWGTALSKRLQTFLDQRGINDPGEDMLDLLFNYADGLHARLDKVRGEAVKEDRNQYALKKYLDCAGIDSSGDMLALVLTDAEKMRDEIAILLTWRSIRPPFWKDGAIDAFDQRPPRSESPTYRAGYDAITAIIQRHK